jgi:hypothetical protein
MEPPSSHPFFEAWSLLQKRLLRSAGDNPGAVAESCASCAIDYRHFQRLVRQKVGEAVSEKDLQEIWRACGTKLRDIEFGIQCESCRNIKATVSIQLKSQGNLSDIDSNKYFHQRLCGECLRTVYEQFSGKGLKRILSYAFGGAHMQDNAIEYQNKSGQLIKAEKERSREEEFRIKEQRREEEFRKVVCFRESLGVGDETSLGLVIEIKLPIVKVQVSGGEKWVKIEQVFPKNYRS